jgi:hypothetical protein
MKILNYKTLGNINSNALDIIVEQHLQLGWQLHGNQYYNGFRYIQVVILEDK